MSTVEHHTRHPIHVRGLGAVLVAGTLVLLTASSQRAVERPQGSRALVTRPSSEGVGTSSVDHAIVRTPSSLGYYLVNIGTGQVTDESAAARVRPSVRALIVDLHGHRLRSVPNLPARAFDVALSPDGGTIAFARKHEHDGVPQVYTMRIDGTGRRRLTDDAHGAFGPTWSPDGRSIAYTGSGTRAAFDIFTMSATGRNPTRLTRTRGMDELQPAWSPDGSRIAYGAPVAYGAGEWLPRQGIRVLRIATGRITRITDRADSVPEWSPDGRRIAFLRQPFPESGGYLNRLVVARADGRHAHRVVDFDPRWRRFDSPPYWSPGGTKLSATAASTSGVFGVYVFHVATGASREVVPEAVGGNWLPNGRAILIRLNGGRICAQTPFRC